MDSKDNFDLCEYIRSHEMSMRRLLSLLRQSQSYCTDMECFASDNEPQSGSCETNFVLILMIVAFALFMYYVRPNLSSTSNLVKPNNINDAPPTPPSSM